ncbi:MAG TPA: CHAT domain-containing protein, partial [Chroococcidiopsis sp.]
MNPVSEPLRLKVQQVGSVCLFELSWGKGQQLSATLPYPTALISFYQDWRRIYLSFYETAEMPIVAAIAPSAPESNLRGRAAESGSIAPSTIDWHARLVEAEAKLLYEFHRWLRSAELFDIRARIAQARRDHPDAEPWVDVFLVCTPLPLARLPWEVWEIGSEFGTTGIIRIVRTPANIRADSGASSNTFSRRSRPRILAILGDDTGLNFQVDQDAVRSLMRIADVQFVGWQPGQTPAQVSTQIGQAIADEQGWDVLVFAGHSNETQITGGELAIAPGSSIQISEIALQLAIAKQRGLQFALFNSCSGLSIAESLIDLGLSQVAVMREPVHNRVAQEFLVRFLQTLGDHKDVHESLLAACQMLKLEQNVTYPSAYLLPSLFRHPEATLFRIPPTGWKQQLKTLLPNRWQAIALSATVALSLYNPVQDFLLNWRVGAQAVYR